MSSFQIQACDRPEFCTALVYGIENVAGENNTSLKPTPVGTLQALMDPENRAGASYRMLEPRGAVRQVLVKRMPRGIDSQTIDEVSCDVTTETFYDGQCINVGLEASVAFETSKEEMQKYCDDALTVIRGGEAPPLFREHTQRVMSVMNGLRENINRQIVTKLLTNVGNNITFDTNVPQTLELLDSVSSGKLEKGIQDFIFQMNDNEVYGTPIVSGFGIFDRFNTSAQFGCCNSNGLNWDGMATFAPYRYYKDVRLGTIAGDKDFFFAFAPGMTQFVYYNDTIMSGLNQDQRHGNTLYGRIPDPFVPGLIYDVAVEEKNCDGEGRRKPTWTVSLYIHFDLAITPDTAYQSGDRLRTVNGASNGIFAYIGATN
jgi:hypothetical protein